MDNDMCRCENNLDAWQGEDFGRSYGRWDSVRERRGAVRT